MSVVAAVTLQDDHPEVLTVRSSSPAIFGAKAVTAAIFEPLSHRTAVFSCDLHELCSVYRVYDAKTTWLWLGKRSGLSLNTSSHNT